MRIRTLDQDTNANQLEVFRGEDGDVYFTIYQNGTEGNGQTEHCGEPVTVRVGMAGSGMFLPGHMSRIIGELADEFEKYKDLKFDGDIPTAPITPPSGNIYFATTPVTEPYKHITRMYIDTETEVGGWGVMVFKTENTSRPCMLCKTRDGNQFVYECENWMMRTSEDLGVDETLTSLLDCVVEHKYDGRHWEQKNKY